MKTKKLKGILGLAIAASVFFNNGIVFAASQNGNDSELLEDKQFSWDNASVYYAMTDRFKNGDTSNDHSYNRSVGEQDAGNYQNRKGTFHGGDLKGLTNEVENGYFDKLGVNAIWISAPYEQVHGAMCAAKFKHYAYHGYYALDYTNVDANMGTSEDLQNFIDTAHTHGIRVVFDVVMNHPGYADPVTASEYGFGKLASNWRDIYYNWNENSYDWYNDYTGEAPNHGSQGIMDPYGDWTTRWWGPDWIRNLPNRFPGYEGHEGDDVQGCSSGLPDFKTESQKLVSLPPILVNKWTKEGRLDKEQKELDEYFNKDNKPRTVRNYLVKWLSDWVREYGVDGFRCDTAKNVELDSWVALKKECKDALKQWRQNNPDKPGAEWTDDFWMTGEVYPHGVNKDDYFTSGAFDSIINFDYKDNEYVFKSPAAIDSVYSEYAGKINNDESFNVLSYMSSHDKGLSRNGDMIQAGTNLELLPGGIEIFYGDETNRPEVDGIHDEKYRGEMNWGSENKAELANWQKVGAFRKNHIAVGAGAHNKLNDYPYTFARTYDKNGISDKVVVAEPGKSGSCTVSVKNNNLTVFSDGESVKDAYTGNVYTVANGCVQVEAGVNGVVLLESNGPSLPTVSINPMDQNYWDDSITVTLNCSKGVTGTYSVDGVDKGIFTNGQKIEVGKDKKVGDETKVTVKGIDADGKQAAEKTATYTKVKKPECLRVHVKNSNWTGTPNMYAYSDDGTSTQLTGKWPGEAMSEEGNGWYTASVKPISAYVIFNGSWGQYPLAQQPGIDLTGEVWVLNNEVYDHNPEKPVVKDLAITDFKAESIGSFVKLTAITNEAKGVVYSFWTFNPEGKWELIKSTTDNNAIWIPSKSGNYVLWIYAKDTNGKSVYKTLDYKVL